MENSAIEKWLSRNKEASLRKNLIGYVRVMFDEEAEWMFSRGSSLSDEWLEVWDCLLPPTVYYLIAAKKGKVGKYNRVLFINKKTADEHSVRKKSDHPDYSKENPAIKLGGITSARLPREEIHDLTEVVQNRAQQVIQQTEGNIRGWWDFAEVALEPISIEDGDLV